MAEQGVNLSDRDLRRYARHLTLPGFGAEGQRTLRASRVLVIGGTSGIGLAVAQLAAERGAVPIVASRRQASVDRALETLPGGAVGLTVDLQELYLTDPSETDDEDQQVIVHETIDLEPVLRDAVVTALPFQPVCRPDCEGLCADCGIRLEDAPEGHAHERVDPRWAALAHLAGTSETSITETEER